MKNLQCILNAILHTLPFRALIVLTITRRDAAGWYVLPFQGDGLTPATLTGAWRTSHQNHKRSREVSELNCNYSADCKHISNILQLITYLQSTE
ncbi:MAG: hypothetical protein LBG58_03370 [Planctomycetaceae bacterium]|nr:hypothetical protein [Planctomycetaceae bacterium]